MKVSFLGLSRFLLGSFLVIFPFQLQSLVYVGTNYSTGNFNPFQVYAVHLSDIILLGALSCWGIAHMRGESVKRLTVGENRIALLIMAFALVVFAGVFFTAQDKVLAFYLLLQMIFMGLFFLMVVNEVLPRDQMIKCFLVGMVFQSGLALAQYFLQHSVGLRFIGEPAITPDTLGVAKIDWDGIKILRSFGTFPHANILGGALFIAIVMSFHEFRKRHLWLVAFLVILSAAFVLSFSRSAAFALIAAFLLYVSLTEDKRVFKFVFLAASLLFFFLVALNLEGVFFQRFFQFGDTDAVIERANYLSISKRMLMASPLGVGLGGFTQSMQDYTGDKILPWVFQPVHNVFMLVGNETGLPGALVLTVLVVYIFYALVKLVSRKKNTIDDRNYGQILLALLGGVVVICFFDHYFYSIYQGQVMAAFLLGLISLYLKRFELPRRKS